MFLALVAWGLSHVFSGRAMYLQIGAMLGTMMAANVLFVIIPVAAQAGRGEGRGRRAPDPVHGMRGKQRSVHNNYFTLPVLLTMISNHYPMTFGHPHAWLVLVVPAAARGLRPAFLQPAASRPHRWAIPVTAALGALALAIAIAPPLRTAGAARGIR